MKTHINRLLTKFKEDKQGKIGFFFEANQVQFDTLLKEFVCTITGSPQYFINFIDGYNDILAQEDNTFKQNEPIQSLVGSLSYFIHEYVLLMSFAISVLSIYSRHPHGTVYHLLHCLVRKLYHMNLSLLFLSIKIRL